MQEATHETVDLAYVDAGYTCHAANDAARQRLIALEVGTLSKAKREFALLLRRRIVNRDITWTSRFRRLTCDQRRLGSSLKVLTLLPTSWLCGTITLAFRV